MTFGQAIGTCFNKYATSAGRSRRAEYWYFVLFNILLSLAAAMIDDGNGAVSGVAGLVTFLPSLAAGVRRLHDTDRSGWWTLLIFVPLIGLVLLIVWLASRGTNGPNRFGPDPLAPV
jgi:uncharacterized membrane protein YhaH (DUF805 family)